MSSRLAIATQQATCSQAHGVQKGSSGPAVAGLANGAFVVAFTDYDYTLNTYQIQQQLFANPALVQRQLPA